MSGNTGDAFANLLLPILILIGLGIVGIIAWLVWTFTRSDEEPAQDAAQIAAQNVTPDAASKAPARASAPVASPRPAPTLNPDPPPVPFLSLKRSPGGDWEISVRGQPYRTLDAVPDPAVQAEVIAALKALATFARDYIQKQKVGATSEPASRPQAAPQPRARPTPSAGAASPPPSSPAELPSLRESQAREMTAPGASLLPTIDFAQEIGEIVDELVAQTPALQSHAVRLLNSPQGGLNFAVDGVIYQEISDIPEPAIQALIRQATKEWERR